MIREHHNADSTVTLEYCCDFCDYSTMDNKESSRDLRPVMECHACGRHVCIGHRKFYMETWVDSHKGMYCVGCWVLGKKHRDQMMSVQHEAWEKENDLRLAWHREGSEEAKRQLARRRRPKLGKIFVSEGYITQQQLDLALSEQMLTIGQVLIRAGRITVQELQEALDYQQKVSKQLGEILKELGHSTPEDIDWALNRMTRKLGEILKERELLSDDKLRHAVVMQRDESSE